MLNNTFREIETLVNMNDDGATWPKCYSLAFDLETSIGG